MDISQTIHLLGDLLGKVISGLESPHIFDLEESIRAHAKARRNGDPAAAPKLRDEVASLDADEARAVSASFATYFDLVNLAEEHHRTALSREEEDESYPKPVRGSISDAIATLKAQGVSSEQMSSLLKSLSIELVLTAHPTETRRRTILSKIQRINQMLDQVSSQSLSLRLREQIIAAMQAEISNLWLTERARTVKLSVTDEVRTGLYFVDSVFWQTFSRLYDDLQDASRSQA
jgi:phosphoenolpyruvate carboxylase